MFFVKVIDVIYEFWLHKPFTILDITAAVLLLFYLYKSLRNHFGQSRPKTIAKFFILNFLTSIMMSILMIAFLLLSFFNL
jgi:hypothetical protein